MLFRVARIRAVAMSLPVNDDNERFRLRYEGCAGIGTSCTIMARHTEV